MLLQEKKTIRSHVPHILFALLSASCNFGPQPECRFPCHCAGGEDCDSLTGECGGSGECERLAPDTDKIETGWTGPGCQTGRNIMQ